MRKKALVALVALALVLAALPLALNPERVELTDAARADAPGQFVRLSQGVVHYELAGPADGQPVVLIHGFSAPYYIWDGTFEALADAGFRVLRYDLYGRGLSDRPRVTYDKPFYETQFLELVEAVGMRQPVDVVAASFGGIVAAALAADHPDAIRRLALVDPAVSAAGSAPFRAPLLGEYLTYAALLPMLPGAQASDFHDPARVPAGWAERYREQMRYRGIGHALLSSTRHTIGEDALGEYRRVGQQGRPVLLIWGEEDHTSPFANNAIAREALVNAEFLPVPQAGHLAHIERPDIVHPRLIEFLQR